MAKGRIGSNDEEYLRTAWEWCGETDKEYHVGIRLTLKPTPRKGVWKLTAQACDVVDKRAVGIRVQVETEWPTVQQQTLAGALLAVLMSLDHQLGIDALQAEPAT